MAELFVNGVQTTLAASISSTATSLTVASATGFPATAGVFRMLIDSEIMNCTARTNNVCTVNRARESTVAAAHSAGATVTLAFTAGALAATITDALLDPALVLGTAAGTTAFFGGVGVTKPVITGSRGGNAAVASLLTQLAAIGLITNSTTA
jgi:hypothetical protein